MSSDPTTRLTGGCGAGPVVEGRALVSRHGFGVRYDLDPANGIIANPDHDLYGEKIKDRVLVFPYPKGGVAAAWALAQLKRNNIGPGGLIFRNTNPVFVQGAVFADVAIIHRLDQDPVAAIRTDDWVRLYPSDGIVEILTQDKESI